MIALLAAAAALACADVLPVYPARVALKADPGRLRLHLDVDAAFWSNEVLGVGSSPPAGEWPREVSEKVASYLKENLQIRVDGAPAEGRLARSRYYYEPWASFMKIGREGAEGRYAFDLEYPLPRAARAVAGRSLLAISEWKEHVAHPENEASVPWRRDFRTIWDGAGARGRTAETTPESPDIFFDIAEVRRSPAQATAEALAAPVVDWRRFLPHYLLLGAAALWTAAAARPRAVFVLAAAVAVMERPWTWTTLAGLFERRWLGPLLGAAGVTALCLALACLTPFLGSIPARHRRLAALVLAAGGLSAFWG